MSTQPTRTRGAAIVSWLILPALALLIVLLDQSTKALVLRNLRPFEMWQPLESLSHLFTITFVTNTGAAFGLLPDRGMIFVIIAIVVSAGILFYFRFIPQHEALIRVSLAMQLGGALGNLIDRVRLGYVVDFVDFRAWPVFNFADTAIVVGVFLLAYRLLLYAEPVPMPRQK